MAKGSLQEECSSAKAESEVRRSQHQHQQSPSQIGALIVPCVWPHSHTRPLQHILCGNQLTQSGKAPVQQLGLSLLVSQRLKLGDWLD